MSEGEIQEEHFSFNRQFNLSEATKIIVKQRFVKDKLTSKIHAKHSETYFISRDDQILLISFYNGYKRVNTIRIFWSNTNERFSYQQLITKYANKKGFEYFYSKEYDISNNPTTYEFCEIQKIARDIGSIPYTLTLSNCNFSTYKLINTLYPDENMKFQINYYGDIQCMIF